MKRILLGALCAVTTLALLTGCVKTTAAPGGSSSAGASGSAPGSASGPITTLPEPRCQAHPRPADGGVERGRRLRDLGHRPCETPATARPPSPSPRTPP